MDFKSKMTTIITILNTAFRYLDDLDKINELSNMAGQLLELWGTNYCDKDDLEGFKLLRLHSIFLYVLQEELPNEIIETLKRENHMGY